jgi:hypothetical protein
MIFIFKLFDAPLDQYYYQSDPFQNPIYHSTLSLIIKYKI